MEIKKMTLHSRVVILVLKIGSLAILLLVAAIILYNVLFNTGILLPANYFEKQAEVLALQLKDSVNIVSNDIQEPISYGLFSNHTLNYIEGNLSNGQIQEAILAITGELKGASRGRAYKVIERVNEYVVLSYELVPKFTNKTLQKLFPNPDITIIGFFVLVFGCSIFVITRKFSQSLSRELDNFKYVSEKIAENELDFSLPESRIREFAQSLDTFDCLRNELCRSIKDKIEQEQLKQDQISALAHDIKIPLTIIKGNAELLSLKNSLFADELSDIQLASVQIDDYVELLILATRHNKAVTMKFSEEPVTLFIDDFIDCASAAIADKVHFDVENEIPKHIVWNIDRHAIMRTFMNILLNAADYAKTQIQFKVWAEDDKLCFTISDDGPGFSDEALVKAKTLFYMDQKSRSNINHFGIGLAFSDSVITAHGGKLTVGNTEAGGAECRIVLKGI